MNLQELDEKELKAMGYDEMLRINVSQQNLQLINKELSDRSMAKEPETDDDSGSE